MIKSWKAAKESVCVLCSLNGCLENKVSFTCLISKISHLNSALTNDSEELMGCEGFLLVISKVFSNLV